MEDTLTSKEIIYTFVDNDELEKYASEINKSYMQKRKNKHVRKRILMNDSHLSRQILKESSPDTEMKIIPSNSNHHFASTINVYDGKVAYFTFKENSITSTLIHNSEIYELNKFLFESLWDSIPGSSSDLPSQAKNN